MVESLQLDPKQNSDGDDDFNQILSMDTSEQQLHNAKTHHKLQEKSITCDIFDENLFEGNKDLYFPTQYVSDMRSFITETPKINVPVYEAKIYEFDQNAIETEMKDFLFSNQQLQCIVKINFKTIPDKVYKNNLGQMIKHYHSQVLLHAFKSNQIEKIYDTLFSFQIFLPENSEKKFNLLKKIIFLPEMTALFNYNYKVLKLAETFESFLYLIDNNHVVKQPRIQNDYSAQVKNQRLLDGIYEAQMLCMEQLHQIRCCFVIQDNEVADFLWSRENCKVLSKERNLNQKDQILTCIKAIGYFAQYHRKNFFHGDIKPDNLFLYQFFEEITSDAGTLLDLGSDQQIDHPRYRVTSFTHGFASDQHVIAVRDQTLLTKKQLFQEDKYQLHQTLKIILRAQKQKNSSKYPQYILTMLSDPILSIIEIYQILKSDIDLWVYLLPTIKHIRIYAEYLPVFSSYRIKCLQCEDKFLKPVEEETKTDVSYDAEKVKILVMHFLRIQIWNRQKIESETAAYFEEIGLKKQMESFKDNYNILFKYRYSREGEQEINLEYLEEELLKMKKDKLLQFLEFVLNELFYLFQPVSDHKEKLEKLVLFLERNLCPKLMKFGPKDAEDLESIISKIMEKFQTENN